MSAVVLGYEHEVSVKEDRYTHQVAQCTAQVHDGEVDQYQPDCGPEVLKHTVREDDEQRAEEGEAARDAHHDADGDVLVEEGGVVPG